jgi:predicted histone-like DNA-binding protein
MSIKYNIIQKSQPGVVGGGDKKYYAVAVTSGERNIEQLTKRIEKISTVSGADIRAVLYALVDVMTDELDQGQIARLGDLGSIRVAISSEGFANETEVTTNAIKGAKIVFTPGPKLKAMLKALKFAKA